jgi:antitoxin VapB
MPLNIRSKQADELDGIALHCAALPVQDSRTADEIVGYGEDGTPRESKFNL